MRHVLDVAHLSGMQNFVMEAKRNAFGVVAGVGRTLKKIGNDGGKRIKNPAAIPNSDAPVMNRRNFIKLLGTLPFVPKSACLNATKPEPCAGLPERFKIKADDMKYIQVGGWGFHPDLAKQICGEDYRS